METVYFLCILGAVIAAYAYVNRVVGRRDYVLCVEAGPMAQTDAQSLQAKSFYDYHRRVIGKNGKPVNTSGMIRVVVQGDCMEPRGIKTGDQLLVRKISHRKPLREQIKTGDILLIHLEDTGISKIRIFKEYDANGNLVTYRYEGEKERESSQPHKVNNVVGVVKYKV